MGRDAAWVRTVGLNLLPSVDSLIQIGSNVAWLQKKDAPAEPLKESTVNSGPEGHVQRSRSWSQGRFRSRRGGPLGSLLFRMKLLDFAHVLRSNAAFLALLYETQNQLPLSCPWSSGAELQHPSQRTGRPA